MDQHSPVSLFINNPYSGHMFTLSVHSFETIFALKERIRDVDGTLMGSFELWDRVVELEDHRRVWEYQFADRTEIQVVPRLHTSPMFVEPAEQTFVPALDPSFLISSATPVSYIDLDPPPSPTSCAKPTAPDPAHRAVPMAQKRTLTMHVIVYERKSKVTLEVYPGTKVVELRKKLELMKEKIGFELPAEGYFFIHRQNVMDEEYSFRWHELRNGDTVEVFPGTIIS